MALTLDKVRTSSELVSPPTILLYGTPGIGKSTFASGAPNPIFIPTENGFGKIDVPTFPVVQTFSDVLSAVNNLGTSPHSFRTLVIDTLDGLERILFTEVARLNGQENIEGIGYGKGYPMVAEKLRSLILQLEKLRTQRNMAIILTAHSLVKSFNDPTTDPYDRYRIDMHDKSISPVAGWVDFILFATRPTVAKKLKESGKSRGREDGEAVIYTRDQPAFLAKRRYVIPDVLPLRWSSFANAYREALKNGNKSPDSNDHVQRSVSGGADESDVSRENHQGGKGSEVDTSG